MTMVNLLKHMLPMELRRILRALSKRIRYGFRRLVIAQAVRRGRTMKIIVGAAETWQPGWYSTNQQWLDIARAEDWRAVFGGRKLLTHVVAEHVFEHLTAEDCRRALRNISEHMVENGRLRIAVPDGYHPDPEYLRHVGIAGIGDDAGDHKQLLNIDSLGDLLRQAGFEVEQVEGYDSSGQLISKPWSDDRGHIRRSRQNESRGDWGFVDAETSLIVDGIRKW